MAKERVYKVETEAARDAVKPDTVITKYEAEVVGEGEDNKVVYIPGDHEATEGTKPQRAQETLPKKFQARSSLANISKQRMP